LSKRHGLFPQPIDADSTEGVARCLEHSGIGLELRPVEPERVGGVVDAVRLVVDDPQAVRGFDDQVGGAIQKAIDIAKLNLIDVSRGCGSWECGCGRAHTVALRTTGKAGSVEVELRPAPRGLGLAGGETVRKVLELAGIEDIWTRSSGNTRTTVNFAKATFNALRNTAQARVPQETWEKREVIE